MPSLPNPRHELFAQALADRQTADKAYVLAGYKANRGNASELNRDERIVNRVAEILNQRERKVTAATERAINRMAITKADVMQMLLDDRQFAYEQGQPAAAITAVKLLGQEIGMFIERKHVTRSSSFAEMDFDQLLAIAQGRAPAPQIEHQVETTDVTDVSED
jgi:phage terminase small subunit